MSESPSSYCWSYQAGCIGAYLQYAVVLEYKYTMQWKQPKTKRHESQTVRTHSHNKQKPPDQVGSVQIKNTFTPVDSPFDQFHHRLNSLKKTQTWTDGIQKRIQTKGCWNMIDEQKETSTQQLEQMMIKPFLSPE